MIILRIALMCLRNISSVNNNSHSISIFSSEKWNDANTQQIHIPDDPLFAEYREREKKIVSIVKVAIHAVSWHILVIFRVLVCILCVQAILFAQLMLVHSCVCCIYQTCHSQFIHELKIVISNVIAYTHTHWPHDIRWIFEKSLRQ